MTSPQTDINVEILSVLVIEMNILRRHVSAYPAGHPVTREAAEKVALLVDQLLDDAESVTIGIARDTILFGDYPLDRRNPVFRDFARVLSDRGVVTLTCHRRLESDELLRFAALLARSREEIAGGGGIEEVARAAGLSRLELRGINYTLFRITEEEWLAGVPELAGGAASLWEQFVRGLQDGTIDPFGEATEKRPTLDPLILAQVLNSYDINAQDRPDESYEAVITAFMRRMDVEAAAGRTGKESAERFAALVEGLNPELRRQFLGKTFTSLAKRPDAAHQVVASVRGETLMEAIAELNEREAAVPPLILSLCQRLGVASSSAGAASLSRAEAARMGQKLGTLFREGSIDNYVPQVYQGSLEHIVASSRIASKLTEAEQLRERLEAENHGAKVGTIIVQILESTPEEEMAGGVGDSLGELCAYYLAAGDFTALRGVCDHLPGRQEAPLTALQQRIQAVVGSPGFLTPLLEAPIVWGKERYEDIRAIISRVGAPCVPPLLDRLASEESMSLRRYYVECLLLLGNATRDEAIARLKDDRWFYVRNLVTILRGLNDPAAIRPLRHLLAHPHPRVRQETLRTLVHFNDPEGERMLLQELGSGKRETLLTAIQLSDRSRSPQVRERLMGLLNKGGITSADLDVRCAVVRALAEGGDTAVLPDLARLLRSRSILRSTSLVRLKAEIVRSLARYPATDALPLLHEAAASKVPEVERAARETLRSLCWRRP